MPTASIQIVASQVPQAEQPKKIYGINGWSLTNFYKIMVAGGGEPGHASGFIVGVFYTGFTAAENGPITSNTDFISSYSGYILSYNSNSEINGYYYSAPNVGKRGPLNYIFSNDNYLHFVIFQFTGAEFRQWLDKQEHAPAVNGSYTAPEGLGLQTLGSNSTYSLPVNAAIIGMMGAQGLHTQAQLEELFDFVREKGDIPTNAQWNYNITRRWSVRDALIGAVVSGQDAPATIPDTVSNLPERAFVKQGAPKILDVNAKVWAYEKIPIFSGGKDWSAANYYRAGPAVARGDVNGFWASILVYVPPTPADSLNHAVVGCVHVGGGWYIQLGSYNKKPGFITYDLSATMRSALSSFDILPHCINLITVMWNGSTKTMSLQHSTGGAKTTTTSGYLPSNTETLQFGNTLFSNTMAKEISIYGFAYGVGIPTGTQITTLYNSVKSTEKMQDIPGLTNHFYRFDDMLPTVNDLQSGAHLTRYGSPTLHKMHARRWGW